MGNEFSEEKCGFLVTIERKKVWSAELDVLTEFDRVCRENGLRYFAIYGTLLGAIRHKGFIPWDDDIDVAMMRDDYDKFVEIAKIAFRVPYEFQGVDNGYVISTHTKVRNGNTTAIEFMEAPASYNQGIFIDVFPIDDANDGEEINRIYFEVKKLLWQIATYPKEMLRLIELGQEFILDGEMVRELCMAGPEEALKQLELFNGEHFGESKLLNTLMGEISGSVPSYKREWFADVIYVPFENIQIPIPSGYDNILKAQFGDYMTPVQAASSHNILILDPDRPYTEYLQ